MKAKKKEPIKPKKGKEIVPAAPEVKEEGAEEETKEGGTLSDGVLDAFEETAPADPLVEEDNLIGEEDDDEDELDYNPSEW